MQFGGSILIPAAEAVFCFFDGTEEGVRAVALQEGVPFRRVLKSLRNYGMSRTRGERQ